ncbi:DUF3180 domain-containing protein [Motilibacter deserti]|uniref:DUF3180 domain-containing protein n=1 Tax=Motilibacter deserti TaxID=2714956 RepID=A0ABX0GX53_9ACTN|nr:DUF3180 domain-containing protein [Motilibacter deserti]
MSDPRPSIRPTSIAWLVAAVLVCAAAVWTLLQVLEARGTDVFAQQWLEIPWTLPTGLLLVALGLGVTALAWRRRLAGAPRSRPVDPLAAARLVGLAKASSHVGAVLAGAYAGYAVYLVPDADMWGDRLWAAAFATGASVLVVVAGLLLERVLRVPEKDDRATSGSH